MAMKLLLKLLLYHFRLPSHRPAYLGHDPHYDTDQNVQQSRVDNLACGL
ncbi:hypothetical protein [Mesorhizobium sp.]|nr:hypothetical protein [Mesorhizobium sp.]